MPYRYRVIPSQRLGIITLHGSVSGETLLAAASAMSNDEAWSPDFDRLTDARGITDLDMGLDDLHALLHLVMEGRSRAARGAIVTSREIDATIADLLRMALRKNRPVALFATMDEALAWLGKDVPADDAEPPRTGRRRTHPDRRIDYSCSDSNSFVSSTGSWTDLHLRTEGRRTGTFRRGFGSDPKQLVVRQTRTRRSPTVMASVGLPGSTAPVRG